ncbi:MAG TPA: hypothetical protein VKK79_25875 [Candidatus Lokiarchaeia archaeon]|nr:hypothetical protein [Candidatus Lokiarchaeia archaeon]
MDVISRGAGLTTPWKPKSGIFNQSNDFIIIHTAVIEFKVVRERISESEGYIYVRASLI